MNTESSSDFDAYNLACAQARATEAARILQAKQDCALALGAALERYRASKEKAKAQAKEARAAERRERQKERLRRKYPNLVPLTPDSSMPPKLAEPGEDAEGWVRAPWRQ